jgi:hypothetical protein
MVLLERSEHLDVLSVALGEAQHGAGRIVLLGGEAGIGKSALVEQFIRTRCATATVLLGGCDALFTPRPLGPFLDMAPDLPVEAPHLMSGQTDWRALSATILTWLRATGRPVVLVVEDAHWADEATLDLLTFLGRRIQQTSALLLITYRDDELAPHHPLRRLLGDLPSSAAHRLSLQTLSQQAVATLAEQAGLAAAELYANTGGNPFFVTEMLAHADAHVPVTVRDVVLARAARLAPEARAVLDLVAIVPGALELWVVMLTLHPEPASVDACLECGLITLGPRGLTFRHELARRAVESVISPMRARALHAQTLHALTDHDAEQVPLARLVHHAVNADDAALIGQLAPRAARQASAMGALPPGAPLRLGAGAGFAGDRLDPAVDLAIRGNLDVLVFEVLAERTIALAQRRRRDGSGPGFDERLVERMAAVLPATLRQKTCVITNGGAADPRAGGLAVRDLAREQGLGSCRVAVVTGDDILARLDLGATVLETGEPLAAYRERLVSANAYLGIAPLLQALEAAPDVVIAGRTSDAALFLAPLVHRFGWALDDWNLLACGSVVGHLLECAGQLTGGYFADGLRKQVPGLARLGFPYADVRADGTAVVTKLPGTGGRVDRATCLEQLLYEVEDPARYLTPDVVVDMRGVLLEENGLDAVWVSGAIGQPAPETLKVSVGVDGGFTGTGAISYAGPGCVRRAQLAAAIVCERWAEVYQRDPAGLQLDLIGQTSCTPWRGVGAQEGAEPPEVRLRVAVQAFERRTAVDLAREVEALYTNGPAGGGGVEVAVRDTVAVLSTLVPRALVTPQVEVLE